MVEEATPCRPYSERLIDRRRFTTSSGRFTTVGPDGTKQCACCREVLDVSQFGKDKQRGHYRAYCRKCTNRKKRDSVSRDPSVRRFERIKSKYGLSKDQLIHLFEKQDGCCAICSIKLDFEAYGFGMTEACGWVIDHDHQTKKPRGLLCYACNTGLGHFSESQERMMIAISYLRNPPCSIHHQA